MDLRRLLRPRSLAVIGGREAAEVVRQCDRMGFAGPIWPVHPTRDEIAGRPCLRSVADLPEAPDAAFVAVNREATVEIVRALARRGAGGAIAYASGFKETDGHGAELQAALVAAADGMPVIGPNCYGLINYLDGALLWPDQHGGRRVQKGVAILAQSSNIALNLTMQRRGLPIALVLTLGNQAMVGLSACIEALIDDPRVTAVGLHIEGLDDVNGFDRAARMALAARKPIVALKVGRSGAGARLAESHTASMAGPDDVIDALFRRLGIARAESLGALLESLKLLHVVGPSQGRSVVSLSCSGGEAALLGDAATGRRLDFRPFSEAERAVLRETLGALVTISNPLDYHTFVWGRREALEPMFRAVLACRFDLSMLVLDFPREDRCDPAPWRIATDALAAAARATGSRAAVLATLPECLPEATAEALIADGLAPLLGIEDGLSAVEAAADIGAAQAKPPPASLLPAGKPQGGVRSLDEYHAKKMFAEAGVARPTGRLVEGADSAVAAAMELGFPVVLKAAGAGLAHKTELGAVALGLENAAAVDAAARRMALLGERLLVESMIEDGVAELLIGIVRDPALGLHLVVAAGGTDTELSKDRQVLLLPTTAEEVRASLFRLRMAPRLTGWRGGPAADLSAAVATILAVGRLAEREAERLLELEINPLILRPAGKGAVAVDALLRLAEGDAADAA